MARCDNYIRDLLFGLLALQNGMVTRDQLVAAFAVWTVTGGKPMADLLVEQAALTPARRGLLDALVADHLAAHGGDPEKSLAALESRPLTLRESLARINDPDIEARSLTSGPGSTVLATTANGRPHMPSARPQAMASDSACFGPTPRGAWALSLLRWTPN